jgi:outer membrane protein OmpA-like peptidoglycan-associated protein
LSLCALLCGLSAQAEAQGRFDVTFVHPAPSQSTSSVGVHGARLLPQWDLEVHALGAFGWSPLALENPDGSPLGKLVSSTTQGHLLFAVGLHERLDIGLDVPLLRNQAGDGIVGFRDTGLGEDHIGVGDLRLVPRLLLLSSFDDLTDRSGVALTLVGDVHLPTGDSEGFAGDDGFRADPRLALEVGFGAGHRLFVNAGYTVRPEARVAGTLEIDDYVALAAALDLRVVKAFHLFGELDAGITPSDQFAADEAPVEARAGVRIPMSGVLLQAGGRLGVSGGATVPDWGLICSIGWRLDRAERERTRDTDRDGVPDILDVCPELAGSLDETPGQEGCPTDTDGDGVFDTVDHCVERAGQGVDGCPTDTDGDGLDDDLDACPDLAGDGADGCAMDTDGDGVADVDDACPNEVGPEPTGCLPDADSDGVPDERDACVDDAEDRDDFEDTDGCPDPDNDNDGVEDATDRCPMVAGPDGGCPVPLELTVLFTTGSGDLTPETEATVEAWIQSLALVDGGADSLRRASLSIVGHTDDTGDERFNRRLSQQRAREVDRALSSLRISSRRTVAVGVGSTEPAVPGESENARSQNRRVNVVLTLPTNEAP